MPKEYTIDNIYGDLTNLTGSVSGPPMPVRDQIPVVSMATRYAFGADEPWKVWVGYAKAGWDTQTRHPHLRWDCDVYYEADADQTSGKSYTCHGGFSDGIELFDCKFFDISPAEARGMDPTQRQVLEVSYIALQGAGFEWEAPGGSALAGSIGCRWGGGSAKSGARATNLGIVLMLFWHCTTQRSTSVVPAQHQRQCT